jgi:hypothetical protein
LNRLCSASKPRNRSAREAPVSWRLLDDGMLISRVLVPARACGRARDSMVTHRKRLVLSLIRVCAYAPLALIRSLDVAKSVRSLIRHVFFRTGEKTMRRLGYSCLCLAAVLALLQAQGAQAATSSTTADLYSITVDENGNGSFVEYAPPAVSPSNIIASGTLPFVHDLPNGGVTYTLPYQININTNSNQWLTVYDPDGTTKSDLVQFANVQLVTGATVGTMNFYSNDTDGDLADVSPAYWATLVGNSSAYGTQENASGVAFYSTYIDLGGVPGDPVPHPTVEAYYYLNSGTTPEPSTLAMLAGFAGMGLTWFRRRSA